MSKKDQLLQKVGNNISESITPQPPAMPAAPAANNRYQGYRRSNDVGYLALDRIMPDPDQPRKTFRSDVLQQMAESIRDQGILQPILVRWSEQERVWIIIAGESRFRAAQLAELTEIPCKLVDGDLDESEIRIQQLAENCHRSKLPPIELAQALKQLQENTAWSIDQLTTETRLKKPYIVKTLALLKLPPELQLQVNDGQLAASVAYELSQVEHAEEQTRLAQEIQDKQLTRDDAVALIKHPEAMKKGSRPITKRFKLEQGTVSVKLNELSDHPDPQIRFLLESAIQQLLARSS